MYLNIVKIDRNTTRLAGDRYSTQQFNNVPFAGLSLASEVYLFLMPVGIPYPSPWNGDGRIHIPLMDQVFLAS